MGINRVDKRGQQRIEVRRRWPDGKTLRRYYPNMTVAKKVYHEIEVSIADGTWPKVREALDGGPPAHRHSIREFSEVFVEQYLKPRSRSWKRYELTFRRFNDEFGDTALPQFDRRMMHRFVHLRSQEVKPGTVNRDVAAVKKMFSYAYETGALDQNPLIRFPLLKVQEVARQNLTVEGFRRLVDCMGCVSLAALVAVLGETGMRKQEALTLKWENVDLEKMVISLGQTKSKRVRHVPVSDFAAAYLRRLVRYVACPYVFVNEGTGKRWVNPEKAFKLSARKAELPWLGFHDLRRFRATQWAFLGVDLKTVQELLGHADIQTTMKYVRSVDASLNKVRELQARESLEPHRRAV